MNNFDKFKESLREKYGREFILENLTDEEFEDFLKKKYGSDWYCVSLTDEEYEKVVPIDSEKIREALRKGFEEARKCWENRQTYKDLGKRFR